MATSNSTNFSLTERKIITGALQVLGVVGADETPDTSDLNTCSVFLNSLIKQWITSGNCVWATEQAWIFPQQGQCEYQLGSAKSTGGDHATRIAIRTTLASSVSASATTATLASVTGMSVNDFVGILLDDGSRFWTTITNINTGTKVITLNDAITGDAESGASVFTYTTKLNKPMRILLVNRVDDLSQQSIPLSGLSQMDYFALPNHLNTSSSGLVTQWYYQPKREHGSFFTWLTPDNVNYSLEITYLRSFEDFDTQGDEPDVPQEWYLALIYNLALAVASVYGKLQKIAAVQPLAALYLSEARSFDNGMGSYYFYANDEK